MSAYTLTIYVDGAASSTVVPVSLSSANECTVKFPLGSTALDARSSRIRCVISDTETEHTLADVTATMGRDDGPDEWVRMPGSRPVTSCTIEAGCFTLAVDVRDDAFLPAVLTAVRVLWHAAKVGRCVQEEEATTVTITDRADDDEADDETDDETDWRPAAVAAPFAHWLRESPLRVPVARVWHGALPGGARRAALRSDAMLLAELYQHRPGTFWLPLQGAEPRCGLERFALEVLRFHLLDGGPTATPPPPEAEAGGGGICGAEFWVQVRRVGARNGSTIAFHWDSDETCMRAGVHVPPLLATVTYLGGVGAPTVVLPLAASERGMALAAVDGATAADGNAGVATGAAYISRPVPGKHLAFDGRLLHGCPTEYSLPPTAATEEKPSAAEEDAGSLRVSLLVNVWRCHRPLAAHRLPAELAARLSSDPDGADGCSNLFVLRGGTESVAPDEWHGAASTGAEAGVALGVPPVTLHIGCGGTHPPVIVRGLPPAGVVHGIAADFVRVPMIHVGMCT